MKPRSHLHRYRPQAQYEIQRLTHTGLTNRGPFNNYIVQDCHDISQFSSLDMATRHAELNRPANIYHRTQVTEIQTDDAGRKFLSLRMFSTPIRSVW